MAGKDSHREETEEEREAYNELVQEAPARQVELSEQPKDVKENEKSLTISESMETSSDLTDMQFAMSKLFPEKVSNNAVMVGRIAPEVFLPMLHLVSVNEIMKCDPSKPINVNEVYTSNYVRLSIGLDGRGRIDTAELLGAVREEKKTERMLGAGGI